MKFNSDDLAVLSSEKRSSYLLAAIILAFGVLFLLIYSIVDIEKSIYPRIVIVLISLSLSFLAYYLTSRKYNRDLALGEKTIKIEEVQEVESIIDYEAGSASINLPVISRIFPFFDREEMKTQSKTYLVIGGYKYSVESTDFIDTKKGSKVVMSYAPHSGVLLSIKPYEK
jgi:hypothetical protein